MVEEIRFSTSKLKEQWLGSTSLDVGLAAAVLTIATAFFMGLAATGLRAAAVLGTEFLGLAVLLLADTLGSLDASVTGWGVGIGCGVGMAGALKTRPLGRRGSTSRPGTSARQRTLPAGLSTRQGGLWWCFFGPVRAPVLHGLPSPLST